MNNPPPGGTPADPNRARASTILLVDDNAAIVRALEYGLERLGFRVFTAGDGATALAILEASDDIDVLLSDVMMPGGMTGVDLARAGRRRRPSLVVLLTTGYAYDVIERLGAGTDEFPTIFKPYSTLALARRIDALLA
jgi:DNA-binding response OmpR family regulator